MGAEVPLTFTEPDGLDPAARFLKNEIIDIVRWSDSEAPRSKQRSIGPSEIGSVCDRRIGYRLAEVPRINKSNDPWPAIVGTAVHHWLERSVERYMRVTGKQDWLLEKTVTVDQFVTGHSDVYHIPSATVVDYKTAGPDVFKHYVADGPGEDYKTQVNLYGRGYLNAGYPVRKVALVFLPRAGWLKDCHVWIDDYRPDVAERALSRLYQIGFSVLDLGLPALAQNWAQVPATPGNFCGHCPWFNPRMKEGADGTGCPGQ